MKRCVAEKRLLAIFEGRGTIPERLHVKGCEPCTARLQHLTADLAMIVQVLREPPPLPQPVPERQLFRLGWVPVAAVGAVALLLVWNQEWRPHVPWLPAPPPGPSVQVRDEDIAELLANDVVPALFATRELGTGTLPKDATNLSYLTAALDGGWPRARCSPGRTRGCDSDPLDFLFEEQDG
jgi:hypothetical protein